MKEASDNILGKLPGELSEWFADRGEPDYRLEQLLDWVYGKRVDDFMEMSNLPEDLREQLSSDFSIRTFQCASRICSDDGDTCKYIFELQDGKLVESVSMHDSGNYTFCISSQVGCGLGCNFCATGAMGFKRNLTTSEILEQVMHLADAAGCYGNVVFMGMGEPLCNLEAVLPALDALTDERRFAIGSRRITVSTCGIPHGIERLSKSPARPNLALSLNAPWNHLRTEIMPVSNKYRLKDVVEACKAYRQRTGRRIMLEYVLLKGVNCSRGCAEGVASLSKEMNAMVNLIAFNPTTSLDYEGPAGRQIAEFKKILEDRGVVVTQRYKRGREISAGCGQLGGECC